MGSRFRLPIAVVLMLLPSLTLAQDFEPEVESCNDPGAIFSGPFADTIEVTTDITMGAVEVSVEISGVITFGGAVFVERLVSAEGTEVLLFADLTSFSGDSAMTWSDLGGQWDGYSSNGLFDFDCDCKIRPLWNSCWGGGLSLLHGESSAGDWTLELNDTYGGVRGTLESWCVLAQEECPVEAPAMTACAWIAGTDEVLLQWTLPQDYDTVEVHRGSSLVAELPGDDTSYIDGDVPDGVHAYTVTGWVTDEDCGSASVVCEVEGTRRVRPIRDIFEGQNAQRPEAYVGEVNGLHLFRMGDLYVTEGTAESTQAIGEFEAVCGAYPEGLGILNDELYISVVGEDHGREIWRTDGTTAGTEFVAEIADGPGADILGRFLTFGEHMYFVGRDGETGMEYWRTDGTQEGTERLLDANPGRADGYTFRNGDIAVSDGKFYFCVDDGKTGVELWSHDGVTTEQVSDIWKGAASSGPEDLVDVEGVLFFSATTPDTGTELWRTIEEDPGVELVRDIRDGAASSRPRMLTPFEDQLLFVASDPDWKLYASDGTEDGTTVLSEEEVDRIEHRMPILNGEAYFVVDPSSTDLWELWKTDGTTEGTVRVAGDDEGSLGARNLVAGPEHIFFLTSETDVWWHLWASDGTEDGTERLMVASNARYSPPAFYAIVDGKAMFRGQSATDAGFVISDGTVRGTELFPTAA